VVGKLSLIQLCSFNYDMVLGLRGLYYRMLSFNCLSVHSILAH